MTNFTELSDLKDILDKHSQACEQRKKHLKPEIAEYCSRFSVLRRWEIPWQLVRDLIAWSAEVGEEEASPQTSKDCPSHRRWVSDKPWRARAGQLTLCNAMKKWSKEARYYLNSTNAPFGATPARLDRTLKYCLSPPSAGR